MFDSDLNEDEEFFCPSGQPEFSFSSHEDDHFISISSSNRSSGDLMWHGAPANWHSTINNPRSIEIRKSLGSVRIDQLSDSDFEAKHY